MSSEKIPEHKIIDAEIFESHKDEIFLVSQQFGVSFEYDDFPSDIYDMDHRDGNHHNNTPENLITICKVCHARKGKESGDFNSQKDSSRIHK